MDLAAARGTLRAGALQGAIAITAADLFATRDVVAGSIALACLALGAAGASLERRTQEWLLAALAAHVVLGMAGGLYARSALYDKLVHLVLSFGLVRLVARASSQHVPGWLLALAALGLGALWELFEFAADATGLVTAQRGLVDTMGDLGADAVGALAAIAARSGATLPACARSSSVSSTRRCSASASPPPLPPPPR